MTEQELADEIGVPRGLLSIERRPGGAFVETEHWHREPPSGRVVFTDAGYDAARAFFKLPPSEKKEGPGGAIQLTIFKHTLNQRILLTKTSDGTLARLRIKPGTARNYPLGKHFSARPVGDPASLLFDLC